MSDVVTEAVAALNAKMDGAGFDGSAKFDIEGEGAIIIDSDGARASDDEADVTLSADTETFKARSEERRVGRECRSRWSPYQ